MPHASLLALLSGGWGIGSAVFSRPPRRLGHLGAPSSNVVGSLSQGGIGVSCVDRDRGVEGVCRRPHPAASSYCARDAKLDLRVRVRDAVASTEYRQNGIFIFDKSSSP